MINLIGLPSKVSEIPIPRSTECFLLEVIDFQTNGTPMDQLIAEKSMAIYTLNARSYAVSRGATSLLMALYICILKV